MNLSKYSIFLVYNDRDEISHFVTGVFEEIEDESRTAMHHDNMDLSRLMVHTKQVKDSSLNKKNREAIKARSFENSSSENRLDVLDKPKFKKIFSNKFPFNFYKNSNDRCSNPKPQWWRNVYPP